MEDSTLLMHWVMNTTLQQEQQAPAVGYSASSHVLHDASHVQDMIMGAPTAESSWIPGGTTDGSVLGHMAAAAAPMDYDVVRLPPSSLNSAGNALSFPIGGNASASSNFSAANTSGQLSDLVYRSQPTKRVTSPRLPYAHEHIMAERKRRENINKRFVELSALIPGLTKMDKATILSNATRYVKELQEDLKAREAAESDPRTINTVMLIKKPIRASPAAGEPLPDVDVLFSGKRVMVRIHCENGKGVIVKVLAEVEEHHLGIIDANVMAFSACTLIITITAKVMEGFTGVTAEEIISRLNSVLSESIIA